MADVDAYEPGNEKATPPAKRYLSVREVAAYTSIAKSTLDKMRCDGRGPEYIPIGARKVVYDQIDVDAWMAKGKRRSTSEY